MGTVSSRKTFHELVYSNLLNLGDYIVVRPEVLGSIYYGGTFMNLRYYDVKKLSDFYVKRVEFTDDVNHTIVITLEDE